MVNVNYVIYIAHPAQAILLVQNAGKDSPYLIINVKVYISSKFFLNSIYFLV